jgi:hypothetical protein
MLAIDARDVLSELRDRYFDLYMPRASAQVEDNRYSEHAKTH